MFMAVTPETETHTGLTPQLPQPSVKSSLTENSRLCGSLRYPSLPGNLDITSGLAEIQKHLSDPVLPVIWGPSVKVFVATSVTLKDSSNTSCGRSHRTSPRINYHYTFGQQVVSQNQIVVACKGFRHKQSWHGFRCSFSDNCNTIIIHSRGKLLNYSMCMMKRAQEFFFTSVIMFYIFLFHPSLVLWALVLFHP